MINVHLNNALGYRTRGITSPVTLTIAYTATQFVIKWKAPATSEMIFYWGDGTTSTVSGNDATLVTTTSSYSGAGSYIFKVGGDVTDLTYIDISSQAFVSGDISGWNALTNLVDIRIAETSLAGDISGWAALSSLTRLLASGLSVSGDISGWSTLTSLINMQIYNTSVSGDISGWDALTSVEHLRFSNTSVSGDISGFSTMTSISSLWAQNTSVTFDSAPAWSASSATLTLQDCSMTSTQVNNMIESLSTCTDSTINVAGTNAHRTAASNSDLNTLIANGNTITLNDVLGAELHTSLNAANDSATEAITAFADYAVTIDGGTQVTQGQDISDMLPLGSELLAAPALDSDDWDKDAGWTYDGGDDEYDCDGTNDADLAITEANDDGKYYLLTVTTNNYVGGDLKARYGQSDYYTFGFTGDETLSTIIRKEITDDELELRSVSYEGSISDVSLKEIEVLGSDLVTNGSFTLGSDLNTSNCVNEDYTTFANATPNGFDATANGSATHTGGTADEISIVSGQKYIVTFDYVLNSGTNPFINLTQNISGTGVTDEGNQTLSGTDSYVFEFTANWTGTGCLLFANAATSTDFEITNLSVKDADTDWTKQASWLVYDNAAHYDGSVSNQYISQNLTMADESWGLVKFTISNWSGTGNCLVQIGANFFQFSGDGIYTGLLQADTTNPNLIFRGANTNTFTLDNVSAHNLLVTKEIAASTAYTGTHYVLPEAGSDLDSFIIPVDYSAEAIVAQKITGETNAVTGFTANNNALVTVEETNVNTGVFAIEAENNTTPTNKGCISLDLNTITTATNIYRMTFSYRHIGSGGIWSAMIGSSISEYQTWIDADPISSAETTYEDRTVYWTHHDTTSRYFSISEISATNDGGVYFDNFSVKQVTFT